VPLISGLSAIADNYDALLCDVWGVLHNGSRAYPGVPDALARFREKGGTVLLLSNAPRPSAALPEMFERLGVPHDVYDGILTSGDATKECLASHRYGTACYHIGPERDLPLFEGTGVSRVAEDDGEFILVTGPFDDETEGPDDYTEQFQRLAARGLPMICANPDILVERGERLIYCAGALARAYEELDGKTVYFGKPHGPIYDIARERLAGFRGEGVPDARILAIGDGLATDIKGANGTGIDALFVTGGVFAAECGDDPEQPEPEKVRIVLAKHGVRAVGAMARLAW